jgi:hypothetical protein
MNTPPLARLTLGSALLCMVAGSALGALMLLSRATGELVWAWRLLPVHQALATRGWLTLLAMGGAYLYLPRQGRIRPREPAAWIAVGLQHVVIVCVAAHAIPYAQAAQLAAALAFAIHTWSRIKSFGS